MIQLVSNWPIYYGIPVICGESEVQERTFNKFGPVLAGYCFKKKTIG